MEYILFDTESIETLYPFTLTRSAATITTGLMTNVERVHMYFGKAPQVLTRDYLQGLYPYIPNASTVICINATVFINTEVYNAISGLGNNEVLIDANQKIIAFKTDARIESLADLYLLMHQSPKQSSPDIIQAILDPWDIFTYNGEHIVSDFNYYTTNRVSQPIPNYVTVVGDADQIFVEEGAKILPCILNTTDGPIYIGSGAEIMENTVVRGPFALLANAALKIGTKAYTNSTIGKGSKVGGEISNVVFFDNSNKGHDGFLGNAVIGEWCNLGADTNSSNLKNNYSLVKVWSMHEQKMVDTNLQFCGLLMGDHSKCGINTMFNTGTVVGVSANIFGANFPEKFIPSFTWGGVDRSDVFAFDKALETANAMMGRRKKSLSAAEIEVLQHAFDHRENK